MKRQHYQGSVSRRAKLLLTIYSLAVLLFFFAELKLFGLDEYLRATNQVLILFALLIMPFVIINMPSFIQSLTFKVSDKELHVQLNEMESNFNKTITKVQQQVSTSEQSFWPILAGTDILADSRLRGTNPRIIIGSKNDPSHLFFTELLALAVTHADPNIKCEIRFPNGDSMHNFAELKYRWIDMYMDFTGTCIQYFQINHKDENCKAKTFAEIRKELNQYGDHLGIKWMQSLGCNEDYCLVITPELQASEKITTLNDLKAKAGKLTLSADPEFINREDCLLGLMDLGIKFNRVLPCSVAERYAALDTDEADVFVGYQSDPQLINKQVVALIDEEQFFPPYTALPLVSNAVVDALPAVEQGLLLLEQCMTTAQLNEIVNKIAKSNFDSQRAKVEAQQVLQQVLS